MILPSEYRCQCGAVVYVGNAACPRCRERNPRPDLDRMPPHDAAAVLAHQRHWLRHYRQRYMEGMPS